MRRRNALLGPCLGLLATLAGVGEASGFDSRDHEIAPLVFDGPGGSKITVAASDQFRAEFVDWWQPPPTSPTPIADYDFVGNRFKLGAGVSTELVEVFAQLQHTLIANLPPGAPGPGGTYYANTPKTFQSEPILRNAWARVQGWGAFRGSSITGGRIPFSDGNETPMKNPALGFLVNKRIKERLIGNFEYTLVGRSFDGGKVQVASDHLSLLVFGFVPTQGGFEIDANEEIAEIHTLGASVTLPDSDWMPNSMGRMFWFLYDDSRDIVVLDNRPLTERQADAGMDIDIHTLGANTIHMEEVGPGRLDLVGWGAYQRGRWQTLDHSAWAYSLEAGYQLPGGWAKPWLRGGVTRGSGDPDPTDGKHGTFFQMLPTARIYAQAPFYNMMNNQDVFLQGFLSPLDGVSVQMEAHWLRVNDGADLAYFGGGATSRTVFGFGGVPALGRNELSYLLEAAVTWQPNRNLTLYGYYGHGFGQGIVNANFVTNDLGYAYVEMIVSF